MVQHLLGLVIFFIVILGENVNFLPFPPKIWNSWKYKFPHISQFLDTTELKLSQKLFIIMNNTMWKNKINSSSNKKVIALQTWHIDIS